MNNEGLPQRGSGIAFASFCLWTFVLLSRPQDLFTFLIPIRPALMMGGLTLGIVSMYSKQLQGPPYFAERQVKYYMALLLIMVLGIPSSLYARLSFVIIFTEYINVIAFFFIFYKLVDSVEKLYRVILIGCLGNGLYLMYSLSKVGLGEGRFTYGEMFDPNDLAYFTLCFMPLNLLFISRDNPFWIRLACLGSFSISTLLILMTGSRGGMLGIGVAGILILVLKTKTIGFFLKSVLVALCFILLNYSPMDTERFMTLFSIQEDYNVTDETGRVAIWTLGLKSMIKNPLTGVGVGCFGNAVGLDRAERGAYTVRWQTAHNSAVQIGTETGVIGLTLFLLLCGNVFMIFHRGKKSAESLKLVKICEMGFVGFAGMFVSAMFLSQAYSLYWAFYVVFSAVTSQLLEKQQAHELVQE